MIQFIPISIGLFGVTVKFILPSSKLTAFILGALFWVCFGPFIKFCIARTLRLIQSQYRLRR
jgi:hypothetical protein